MTNHPLGDELYAAYTAGALSGPMRLLVAAQAELNPTIARSCQVSDALAGALFESLKPDPLQESTLETVLAVIDAEERGVGEASSNSEAMRKSAAERAGQSIQELLSLPEAVRDLALEKAKWGFAGPGVRKMTLMESEGAKAELIRLEPGRGVPHHGHEGREFTLVLCGSFHDGRDRFHKGELCAVDQDTHHKPIADPGEVCIALAVTDGALAFTGPLGWIQRAMTFSN